MIQAINSANSNYSGIKNNPSFARMPEDREQAQRPPKALRVGGYLAQQFAAGVIVQGVIDGVVNGYRAITKKTPLIPFKQIASRAAFTGGLFALIGIVFAGVEAMMIKKHNKQ